MAALDTPLAKDMYDLATDLGMSALFEVHNKAELDQALSLSPKILGVNNRNLKTLDVSLDTSRDLISSIPDGIIRISESGIASSHDVTSLYNSGYDGFLIGESLMNKTDESSSLRTLLNS
jgi:indole-3-glycerol phosphate synthase